MDSWSPATTRLAVSISRIQPTQAPAASRPARSTSAAYLPTQIFLPRICSGETINLTGVTNPEAGLNSSTVRTSLTAEVGLVKRADEDLGTGATCFASGNQSLTMWAFKADVLRLLPMQMDLNGPTGKRLANGNHTVRLPDAGGGNQVPESAGAGAARVLSESRARSQ